MYQQIVVDKEKFEQLRRTWASRNPMLGHVHATTDMLEDFGLMYFRLTRDMKSIRLRVVDEKKLMMAKIRYEF
jgi:hypothetical protein